MGQSSCNPSTTIPPPHLAFFALLSSRAGTVCTSAHGNGARPCPRDTIKYCRTIQGRDNMHKRGMYVCLFVHSSGRMSVKLLPVHPSLLRGSLSSTSLSVHIAQHRSTEPFFIVIFIAPVAAPYRCYVFFFLILRCFLVPLKMCLAENERRVSGCLLFGERLS